jgi:hypothetical protein
MSAELFAGWARGFSGCDGGDLGSSAARSTWVCGIEWGGGARPDEWETSLSEDVSAPPLGYDDAEHNLRYIFNWQTVKLLTAIAVGRVGDYRTTAATVRPFVRGSVGFFKMNLYPLAFKNTSHAMWMKGFDRLTGFGAKQDYIEWCRENRFPILRQRARSHQPKLIVCFGKTYLDDFKAAFGDGDDSDRSEIVADRELRWFWTSFGTLVVVCPFPVNRHGLNSNARLQAFGERIAHILGDPPQQVRVGEANV